MENKGKQGRRDVWEQIMGELIYAAEESRLYTVGKEAGQGFRAETKHDEDHCLRKSTWAPMKRMQKGPDY